MGLIIPINGSNGRLKKGFSVKTIGRVLFPLTTTPNRERLQSAVRSVVAELKK